jgi:hypothetical protein
VRVARRRDPIGAFHVGFVSHVPCRIEIAIYGTERDKTITPIDLSTKSDLAVRSLILSISEGAGFPVTGGALTTAD